MKPVNLAMLALGFSSAFMINGSAQALTTINRPLVHGTPRCPGDPVPFYVARRANPAGTPTDDATIVEGILDSDEPLEGVLVAVRANLGVVDRAKGVRDFSKLFARVLPDGSRVPLRVPADFDEGLTPIRIELVRYLPDKVLDKLPLILPLHIAIRPAGGGPDIATSPSGTWRIGRTGGELTGSAPGGRLVRLPDGSEPIPDASQVGVLYGGCRTLPNGVAYRVTGIAITGQSDPSSDGVSRIVIREGSPDGPEIVVIDDPVLLPDMRPARRVIDTPDILVGADDSATTTFFVELTYGDGLTAIQVHLDPQAEIVDGVRDFTYYRVDSDTAVQSVDGVSTAIDLLLDGRLETAD